MKRQLLPSTMHFAKKDVRSTLLALGLGNFNSTAAIPYMFMAVSTTDPQMPPVILIIKGLQNRLGVPVTGVLDEDTQHALAHYVSPAWKTMAWADVARAALEAQAVIPPYHPPGGFRRYSFEEVLMPEPGSPLSTRGAKTMQTVKDGMAGITDSLGLPDIPGGIVTYGVGAYLLYRHFKKKAA